MRSGEGFVLCARETEIVARKQCKTSIHCSLVFVAVSHHRRRHLCDEAPPVKRCIPIIICYFGGLDGLLVYTCAGESVISSSNKLLLLDGVDHLNTNVSIHELYSKLLKGGINRGLYRGLL